MSGEWVNSCTWTPSSVLYFGQCEAIPSQKAKKVSYPGKHLATIKPKQQQQQQSFKKSGKPTATQSSAKSLDIDPLVLWGSCL